MLTVAVEVDVDDGRGPRVGRHLRPGRRVRGVHLIVAFTRRIDRRIVGQPRVVIHVVQRAVVHRRRPHQPVLVGPQRIRPACRRSRGVDRDAGQRARVDAGRTGRRSPAVAARAGAGSVEAGRVITVWHAVLRKNVSGRRVLAAADKGEIADCADVSASGAARTQSVAAEETGSHVVGQKVRQHRRRIVDGEHDVRLGLVLDVQRLVGERRQGGIRRGGQRPEADQQCKQRGQPAADERGTGWYSMFYSPCAAFTLAASPVRTMRCSAVHRPGS